MRRARLNLHLTLATCGVVALLGLRAAQPPSLPVSAGTSRLSAPVPAPPLPKSATEIFRELLAMTDAERERTLAARSPEHSRFIRAKIQEYLDLAPAEREKRLRLLDLRGHLLPLMHTKPADRSPLLSLVPAPDRAAVLDRLREWDKLSGDDQREFLDHEGVLSYMVRLESTTPEQRNALLRDFSPERRRHLENELQRWRSLPEENRRRMADRFHRYFELDDREQEKTLNTLTDTERQQIERTLQAFKNLQPEQRRSCIEAFGKFASMSVEERNQFLKNAQRWESMSPDDRSVWRNLVQKAPPMPPLPPGLRQMPPLPPGLLVAGTNSTN